MIGNKRHQWCDIL